MLLFRTLLLSILKLALMHYVNTNLNNVCRNYRSLGKYYTKPFSDNTICDVNDIYDTKKDDLTIDSIDIGITNQYKCDGLACGKITIDELPKEYKEFFFTKETIDKLNEASSTGSSDPLRPLNPGLYPEMTQHDNDKCCPTESVIETRQSLNNIHGKLKTIVNFDGFNQLIPVGNCVTVSWGCSNCQQQQRLHFLLAMDPDTGEIMLDMFYVNSHCTCVQK